MLAFSPPNTISLDSIKSFEACFSRKNSGLYTNFGKMFSSNLILSGMIVILIINKQIKLNTFIFYTKNKSN